MFILPLFPLKLHCWNACYVWILWTYVFLCNYSFRFTHFFYVTHSSCLGRLPSGTVFILTKEHTSVCPGVGPPGSYSFSVSPLFWRIILLDVPFWVGRYIHPELRKFHSRTSGFLCSRPCFCFLWRWPLPLAAYICFCSYLFAAFFR